MSKRRSYNSRMNRAVSEASNEHDGAYNDPLAMKLISENYKVDYLELCKNVDRELRIHKMYRDEEE